MAAGKLGNVIVVPGITGSTISYPFNLWGLGVLWPNPYALMIGGMRDMRLPVEGEGGGTSKSETLLPGLPIYPYYGTLIEYLRHQGWFVTSSTQDWRRPLDEDGERLLQLIKNQSSLSVLNPATCSLVAHSRGGLLTRYALAKLAAAGELARVQRVVGLGVPHRGSLYAAYSLAGPYDLAEKLQRMAAAAAKFGWGKLSLGETHLAVRSWPALYQLLPDPNRNSLPAGVAAALYQAATWADADPPPVTQYLTDAAASWPTLPETFAGVDWIDVVGYGLDTADGAESAAQIVAREATATPGGGDGTVPLWSARPVARRAIYSPSMHAALPYDTRLLPVIHEALLTGIEADRTLTGDVLVVPGS